MTRKTDRGKGQVLTTYLPGKTFDFPGGTTIAQVTSIRGVSKENELNLPVVRQRVAEAARAWSEESRRSLKDAILNDNDYFVLLDPTNVETEIFPKVFWCQNTRCSRVFDHSSSGNIPNSTTCKACEKGTLAQLRFVQIHRCGAMKPLVPPRCDSCKKNNHMALHTRGSERIRNFQWVCQGCNNSQPKGVYGDLCQQCRGNAPGSGTGDPRRMNVIVHRTGSSFYPHSATMLNIPSKEMETFFSRVPEWYAVSAAKFLEIPEAQGRSLTEFVEESVKIQEEDVGAVKSKDLDDLLADAASKSGQELADSLRELQERQRAEKPSSASDIAKALQKRTGVSEPSWSEAGQDMLEAVMPRETGVPHDLELGEDNGLATSPSVKNARKLGMTGLSLIEDFPMVTATYGFSREMYQPNECELRPFPLKVDQGNKHPIFVDKVQADALVFRLDASRVIRWLERNNQQIKLPSGEVGYAERGFFVELFEGAPVRQTLKADQAVRRMVFGLMHTLTHLGVRRASLLSGLERNSLSEYMLPRALTSAIYCNHRSSATIGALTALYEQSLSEWLASVLDSRLCVYDPICKRREGSCHACTHLAETSCSYFNLNLGRAFLFGGRDPELKEDLIGFLDPTLDVAQDGD